VEPFGAGRARKVCPEKLMDVYLRLERARKMRIWDFVKAGVLLSIS
jgi:hypothetical protein